MQCRQCRRELAANAAFCDECGAPLENVCSSCGGVLRAGAHFCAVCGHPRNASAVEQTVMAAAPSTLPAGRIIEEILLSSSAAPGERKELSVLFADVKGSMELIAERDPEQAQMILDPVLGLMIGAVHRYEGTVCQVMGDGIMALFGAPTAQEDHAVRACRAALHLLEKIKDCAVDLRAQYGIDMQVRVGLNSGEVVVRGIRTDVRLESYRRRAGCASSSSHGATGAPPERFFMTESTLSSVEGHVDVKSLGSVPIKGMKNRVQIYELLGARAVPSRFKARHGSLSRFVGRDAELTFLLGILGRMHGGYGQIVALVGEPGIGKSRLAYELRQSWQARGCVCLEGRSVSYGQRTAYVACSIAAKGASRRGC